jgi:hypothetical protein
MIALPVPPFLADAKYFLARSIASGGNAARVAASFSNAG